MGDKIYSIGYGSRTIEEFIELLKLYGISYLIDVRSSPYSKFNQKFNRPELDLCLKRVGIRYVFMGDELGGRPEDLSCYNSDGKVDYNTIKTKEFYKEGIFRIKTAYNKDIPVALMCSEGNPAHCHRSKLIGMTLLEDVDEKIILSHIDECGKVKDQADVMNEVNKGKSPFDLFDDSHISTSRKSYIRNGNQ